MRARNRPDRSRPPSPPLPSSRPNAERVAFAEAIEQPDINGRAFRPGWLVRSRLDGLLADGLIDRETYAAAQSVARDYRAVSGAPSSPIARLGMSRVAGREDAIASRIDAARRLRAVRARIGEGAYSLAVAVVAEDTSWRELGKRLGVRDVTAKSAAVEALGRLSETAR